MINHWFFKCKDVSKMISKSYDEEHPLRTRLGIKLHLMMCRLCRSYHAQIDVIQKALGFLREDLEQRQPQKKLPEDMKAKLKDMLQ